MFVTGKHTIIWASTKNFSQLSPKVLSVFEKADKGESLVYIPSVVLWEVAILQSLGKINSQERFDYWANQLLKKQGFKVIPLDVSIIANAVGYNFNNDVFDKLLSQVLLNLICL